MTQITFNIHDSTSLIDDGWYERASLMPCRSACGSYCYLDASDTCIGNSNSTGFIVLASSRCLAVRLAKFTLSTLITILFRLFVMQLRLHTNRHQLSIRILTPDFSHACHVTLARVFLQRYMELDTLPFILLLVALIYINESFTNYEYMYTIYMYMFRTK